MYIHAPLVHSLYVVRYGFPRCNDFCTTLVRSYLTYETHHLYPCIDSSPVHVIERGMGSCQYSNTQLDTMVCTRVSVLSVRFGIGVYRGVVNVSSLSHF